MKKTKTEIFDEELSGYLSRRLIERYNMVIFEKHLTSWLSDNIWAFRKEFKEKSKGGAK